MRYLGAVKGKAPSPRPIVRYANRKLYDAAARRYLTLEELSGLVAAGAEVTVTDKNTGRDITAVVLGQALVETLKRRTTSLPTRILQRIITLASSGREIRERLAGPDTTARVKNEAERIASELIARGRLGLEDAAALRSSIIEAASQAVAETQRSIEKRLSDLVTSSEREFGVTPSLSRLKERLVTLDARLPYPRAKHSERGRRRSQSRRQSS